MNIPYAGDITLKHGLRRSGKTTELIRSVLEHARTNHGSKILVITPSGHRSSVQLMLKLNEDAGHDVKWSSGNTQKIGLFNESEIHFRSSYGLDPQAGAHRMVYELIVIDEIGMLEEKHWDALNLRLDRTGSGRPPILGYFTQSQAEQAQLRSMGR